MKKGQWFLISAVIASGVFLAISVLFQGYYTSKPYAIAQINEDFYFKTIKEQLGNVVALSTCGVDFDKNYNEFVYLARQSMAGTGYYLFINRTAPCPPQFGILLASERAMFYENVNPEEVLIS
jgi:hypothetical protein